MSVLLQTLISLTLNVFATTLMNNPGQEVVVFAIKLRLEAAEFSDVGIFSNDQHQVVFTQHVIC